VYFWDVNPLLADLQRDRLSNSEKTRYYLLYIFVVITAYAFCIYFLGIWKQIIDFCDLLLIAINVIGVWVCYVVNSRGDNKSFLTRFVSLSIPVLSKTVIYTIAFSAIALRVLQHLDLDHFGNRSGHGESGALALLLYIIMVWTVYYLWLASLLSLISNMRKDLR